LASVARPAAPPDVAADGRRDRAVLIVQDTGLGIDPAELSRVFDRFYRGESAERAAIPGTGLGLAPGPGTHRVERRQRVPAF